MGYGISIREVRRRETRLGEAEETFASRDKARLALRYLWLFAGVAVNSFGVVLITKGGLGTSPISSLPYVLSLAVPGMSFGMLTFILNLVFIVAQMMMLKRDFKPIQFLQLAVNVLFSWLIDVDASLLTAFSPEGIAAQVASTVAGCATLAFGICVELAPDVIAAPGEGIVRAIAAVVGRRVGSVKAVFDAVLVSIALVLSFVFFGRLNGLGVGTVISALLVGRLVNLFNRHVAPLERIRALAR